MILPIHFLKFYLFDSFVIFARVWHNLMLVIEEDLAVGLMFKLLFVPLFHDSTIIGRIISFVFRLTRILYGIFAFALATSLISVCALIWYVTPFLAIYGLIFQPASLFWFRIFNLFEIVSLFTVALFIHHLYHAPPKKIWQIKTTKDIFSATKLNKKQITWDYLIQTSEVQNLLQSIEFKGKNFSSQQIPVSENLLLKTTDLAKDTGAPYLTPAYFWMAMLTQIPGVENELLKHDLTLDHFYGALNFMEHKRASWRKTFVWDDDFFVKHLKGINRGWMGAPTPALDGSSIDLTKIAARDGFEDFVGRSTIVNEVITILSQEKDRNVLLVGQAGSGKSTLVNYLAKQIVLGDAPEALATKRLVQLDAPRLLSNTRTEGELAEKIKNIFNEVSFLEDIIIYIDEIHTLGMGDAGENYNLFSLLLPYIESDRFQFLASTEDNNYARIMEKNSSFLRIFHKVELPPASPDETRQIIFERAVNLARFEKIDITYTAIKVLVENSAKLIHDRVLPDSALSVLEECKVLAENKKITSDIVKKVLEKRVNVPIVELDSAQKDLLLNLEDVIHKHLIDQEEAVKIVSETLRRGAVSLRESNRPIGSFLLVGPTGVGKTELAKILSSTYFKNSGAFIRFDMSEYQTEQAVNRLLGTLEEPGELTEAIKNKPYALLLLDEFEKADPKILTLFLQILEDGRLTDARGTTVDFTNTIIIATSNAASLLIAQELEKGTKIPQLETMVKDELLKIMKPELVNRFDSVVIFKPLDQPNLEKIVHLKLNDLEKILKDQGYLIEFTPELISELAKKGFDPVLGARPLRRLIQDTLESKLSRMILLNELKKGEVFKAGVELLG